MKAYKKQIEEAVIFIDKFLNTPQIQMNPESQKLVNQALSLLIKCKSTVQITAQGRFKNKCFLCSSTDLENNCLNLSCQCFEACHKSCIKQTVILMSPDLNPAKIKINCPTCARDVSFETIQSCFSQEELNEIRNRYFCKFCNNAIPAEMHDSYLKKCLCHQFFHKECMKNHAKMASRGLNQDELSRKLFCWKCKQPFSFDLLRQCFNDREFKNIQEEDENLKYIDEMQRQEKEAIKEAARKKTALCEVCGEDKVVETEFLTLDCEHRFCIKCLKGFTEELVKQNKVNEIELICPQNGCKRPISIHILKNIMEKEVFEKYDTYNLHHNQSNIISVTEVALRCPNANCKNFFVMEKNSGINFHICELCKLDFCVNGCKEPHRKMTCKQYQEHLAELRRQEEERRLAEIARIQEEARRAEEMRKFNAWKAENDRADEQFNLLVAREKLSNCPQCHVWGQKISGCNHITCTRCKFEFCYVCFLKWRTCGH